VRTKKRPSQGDIDEAMALAMAREEALGEWSFMMAALGPDKGTVDQRKEVAKKEVEYRHLKKSYDDHCRNNGLCRTCGGDGIWAVSDDPEDIGTCPTCNGTGIYTRR
jgi:DnaJ-class molecular chaperone